MENGKVLKLMIFKLKKIKSDASFREFYRLHKGKKTSIVVKSETDKLRNLIIYCAVNKYLNTKGIKAPKLLKQNFSQGMIEIEDFGDNILFKKLKVSKNKLNIYKKCIDVILKLQKIKTPKSLKLHLKKNYILKKYNLRELHKESDLFFDWYLKLLKGKVKSRKYKKLIKKELNFLYKKIFFKNSILVHRDFHVSNLIIKRGSLGVIDTQDMIIGNPLYDVASLIDDVRIKTNLSLKNKIFNYYVKKRKFKDNMINNIKNDFELLSIQRNLKILGIFCRLYLRDKKPNYLKYLPYTWKLLELRMKRKIFQKLKHLLKKAVNQNIRKKIRLNEY